MPIYAVNSFQTSGNPVDGYEIDGVSPVPDLYTQRNHRNPGGEILQALTDANRLGEAMNSMYNDFHPQAMAIANGTFVIRANEVAWSGRNRAGTDRFIDMIYLDHRASTAARSIATTKLRAGEALVRVEGMRPMLELIPQQLAELGPDEAGVEFFSINIEQQPTKPGKRRGRGPCGVCQPPGILQEMNADEIEGGETQTCDECGIYASDRLAQHALAEIMGYMLSVEVGYYADVERIGIEVRGNDGNTSDRFEWPIAEWMANPTFGFNPLTMAPLPLPPGVLPNLLVALDHFLATGTIWRQ